MPSLFKVKGDEVFGVVSDTFLEDPGVELFSSSSSFLLSLASSSDTDPGEGDVFPWQLSLLLLLLLLLLFSQCDPSMSMSSLCRPSELTEWMCITCVSRAV